MTNPENPSLAPKYLNLVDGKIYELISQDGDGVTYKREGRETPYYLGRDEFDRRFQMRTPPPAPISLGASFETVAEAYLLDEAKPVAGTHWTAADISKAFLAGAKFGRMRAANEFLASQSVQAPQNNAEALK